MKLTNYQLNILTDEIYKSVKDKIKKYENSKSFKRELDKYIKEHSEVIELVEEYENVNNSINELKSHLLKLKNDIIEKGNYKFYSCPTSVELLIKRKTEDIISEFSKDLPSKQSIKSQIVLLNLNGSKDIIKAVKQVFNL